MTHKNWLFLLCRIKQVSDCFLRLGASSRKVLCEPMHIAFKTSHPIAVLTTTIYRKSRTCGSNACLPFFIGCMNAHENLSMPATLFQGKVNRRQALKTEGFDNAVHAQPCSFSRIIHFRRKVRIDELGRGELSPGEARQQNKSQCSGPNTNQGQESRKGVRLAAKEIFLLST